MPDSIKDFVVSLGFAVDNSSLNKMRESLKQTEQQVNRFSQSTHRGAHLWQRFFTQFSRASGPQREQIEIANRLGKSYELLGINLKQLATLATGGTLAASFTNLTKTFTDLYYAAQQAGTSVADLEGAMFSAQRVGIPGQQMAGMIANLRRGLMGLGAPDIVQATMGLNLRGMDPQQAMMAFAQRASQMYQANAAQRALLAQTMSRLGLQMTPELEAVFKNPLLMRELLQGPQQYQNLLQRMGLTPERVQQIAEQSRALTNQWNELLTAIGLVRDRLEAGLQPVATRVLKWIEDEIIQINAYFKQTGFDPAKWGADIGQALAHVPWEELGKDASKRFMQGFVDLIKAGGQQAEINAAIRQAIGDFVKGFWAEEAPQIRGAIGQVPGGQAFLGAPAEIAGGLGIAGRPAAEAGPPTEWSVGGLWGWLWGGLKSHDPVHMWRGWWGSGDRPATQHQLGGIVGLHAGELIFSQDTVRAMSDWLRGVGSYRPLVTIDNVQDFLTQDVETPPEGGPTLVPGGAMKRFPPGAPGLGDPTTALGAIERFESGGRNVINYMADAMHTASGFWQITNTTWRQAAQQYGIPAALAYTRAMDAPRELQQEVASALYQREGFSPWAPYNARLRGFLEGHPGFPVGYEGRHPLMTAQLPPMRLPSAAPLTTTNNTWNTGGNRSLSVDNSTTVHIVGSDGLATGGLLNSVISRQNADLIRSLSPTVL